MAAPFHPGSIVVGVDGSKHAGHAVTWAAEEAQRQGGRLQLLHAVDIDWLVAATVIRRTHDRPTTDDVVDQAMAQVREGFPDLEVTAQATTGTPAHDLIQASAHAAEVVVGARGRTGAQLPLGSVAHAVAMHAACPVVVVRESDWRPAATAPVVVGVDGSARSAKAIDFALEQAARRGVRLVVLHAWWLEFVDGVVVTTPGSPEWQRTEELLRLGVAESLAGRRQNHPDVEVVTEIVHTRPAEALVEASQTASLVVVGARGRGGFAGLLLGSVSRELLMHASGPVAVVRPL